MPTMSIRLPVQDLLPESPPRFLRPGEELADSGFNPRIFAGPERPCDGRVRPVRREVFVPLGVRLPLGVEAEDASAIDAFLNHQVHDELNGVVAVGRGAACNACVPTVVPDLGDRHVVRLVFSHPTPVNKPTRLFSTPPLTLYRRCKSVMDASIAAIP